jgi:hypothetical protein
MTITFELGSGQRTFNTSVNGGPGPSFMLTSGNSDWNTPQNAVVGIPLAAGSNSIRFYNATADAPDLDKITIS